METNGTLYGRGVAETLLRAAGEERRFVVDERGVWIAKGGDSVCLPQAEADVLHWHPLVELDEEGSPDPSSEPSLPFPFSASKLAAFMLDGAGLFVQEAFGEWEGGPDEAALILFGVQGTKAREVLRGAYESYRRASQYVGGIKPALDEAARESVKRYRNADGEANQREGIYEVGISDDEYGQRRARARDSVAPLATEMGNAQTRARSMRDTWRKEMVRFLLVSATETGAAMPAEMSPEFAAVAPTSSGDRQHVRFERYLTLGGIRVPKAGGGWKASGVRGALAALAREETVAGHQYNDVRDVARDLDAEADRRRAGRTMPSH